MTYQFVMNASILIQSMSEERVKKKKFDFRHFFSELRHRIPFFEFAVLTWLNPNNYEIERCYRDQKQSNGVEC